ncbi:MAG: M48 family metallopeptidase [Candidatus Omnitrophica bacterium]|nr:M48 family metallopeptidase [Candidatus Omnitrophota bacterium]MDD5611303.1 M48 family metallopeptidase [Candidatus Omnitrophota bacterium]
MKANLFSQALFILFLSSLFGCSPEYNLATKKEEMIYYSTEREVKIGTAVDREIAKSKEEELKLTDDPLLTERVENIGQRIVAVCDRKDITYHFRVLQDKEVNAFSLPGGYVYINEGLINKVDNDDELAAVIAHEIAHIVARHSIKRLQAEMGYTLLRLATASIPQSQGVNASADMAFEQILMGYSRDDELLADKLGARYCKLAGYNPGAMITFLKKLELVNRKMPLRPKSYLKSHPYTPDRIRTVKEELGENMNFDDFINIEQVHERPLE